MRVSDGTFLRMAAIFMVVIIAVSCAQCFNSEEPQEYVPYVVDKGDTLWAIARSCRGRNTRETLQYILDENNLQSCAIQPGQLIYIPKFEEESSGTNERELQNDNKKKQRNAEKYARG